MSTTAFDTLGAARVLEAAVSNPGTPKPPVSAVNLAQGDLATKDYLDVRLTRFDTPATRQITYLDNRVTKQVADLKAEMFRIAIGLALTIVTLTVGSTVGPISLLQS